MDLTLDPADVAFRDEVRSWLAGNLDRDWRDKCASETDWVEYQKEWDLRLAAGGWTGLWWPREFGGSGASAARRAIFEEELARAGAPEGLGKVGRRLVAPALMKFGTQEQQERYLQGMLAGTDAWCQGYSEPEAGSDLASVRTKAVRAGDAYIVDGSKIWTSYAQYCDRCFLLARTNLDAEKHAGLSLLLIEMEQEGVEVRPIHDILGNTAFCQVFLSGAKASIDDLLGTEGQGWEVATYILAYERGAGQALARLIKIEQHLEAYRAEALNDEQAAIDLARATTEVAAARLLAYSILSTQMHGGDPGATGSITKLFWSEAWHRLAERALLHGGERALTEAWASSDSLALASLFLDARWSTISSGTSEIQRNIVARHVLRLPRE